jgi:hypothetical protein
MRLLRMACLPLAQKGWRLPRVQPWCHLQASCFQALLLLLLAGSQ